jgi:ribulose 1,5-bisphosphate synthetase/thiazole synthase
MAFYHRKTVQIMQRYGLRTLKRSFVLRSTTSAAAERSFSTATAVERVSMPFDVLVVGGGPAGLAASIRLKQLCEQHDKELSVCLIDKGR